MVAQRCTQNSVVPSRTSRVQPHDCQVHGNCSLYHAWLLSYFFQSQESYKQIAALHIFSQCSPWSVSPDSTVVLFALKHILEYPGMIIRHHHPLLLVQDGIEHLLSAREEDPFEDMPGRYAWEQAGSIQRSSTEVAFVHRYAAMQLVRQQVSRHLPSICRANLDASRPVSWRWWRWSHGSMT